MRVSRQLVTLVKLALMLLQNIKPQKEDRAVREKSKKI